MPGGLTPPFLDDSMTMDEWLRQRNRQLGGDPSWEDADADGAPPAASGPPLPTPFSVPDPDAETWRTMVAQNGALQAHNDPLGGGAPDVGAPSDSLSEELRLAQMPNADWQAARSRQMAGQYDPSPPAAGSSPVGTGSQIYRLDQLDAARRQAEGPGDGTPYDQLAPEAVDKAAQDFAPPPFAPLPPTAPPASSPKRDAARAYGAGTVLDLLSHSEGTAGDAGYDTVFGYKKGYPPGWAPPSQLTLDQWSVLAKEMPKYGGGKAIGKYQFTPDILTDVRKAMGLTGAEIATPELQERMGREALRIAGYDKYLAGKSNDTGELQEGLARYWGSVPGKNGKLRSPGQHQGATMAEIQATIAQAAAEADAAGGWDAALAAKAWR